MVDYFVEVANTYPWVWGFYALAIVAPFVICVGCCCVKTKVSGIRLPLTLICKFNAHNYAMRPQCLTFEPCLCSHWFLNVHLA